MIVEIKTDDGRDETINVREEWWKTRDGRVFRRYNGGEPELTPSTDVPIVIVKCEAPKWT